MPDFTHQSNYSEETSFSQVLFGSSAPVLETEMNELQEIINTKFKYLNILIGESGAIFGGSISYNPVTNKVRVYKCYALNQNGLFVYIDDAEVELSSTNCIAYIELSETTVTGNDTLKSYGNTDGSTITNTIYDDRLGAETSRRKVVTYTLKTSSGSESLGNGNVLIGGLTTENNEDVFTLSPYALTNNQVSIIEKLNYLTERVLPLENGGTGENNRYSAYNSLALTVRSGVESLSDLKESGWNFVVVYNSPNLEIPNRDDNETPTWGLLYNINPHPTTNNGLMQIWVDFGLYGVPNIAIRHAISGGSSASDVTFRNWVKILTEKSLFLNRSYIEENSSKVFNVFGVATGGSGSYEYAYYYQEDNGNLIPVITNTASHKFITGGVQITFNSATTNAYIKVKVKDTNTMEIQTKEFEIEFESE